MASIQASDPVASRKRPASPDEQARRKNFKCDPCDQGFTTNRALLRHLRESWRHQAGSQTEQYVCSECPTTFAREYNLQRHYREQHGDGKEPCPRCGKRVRSYSFHKNSDGDACIPQSGAPGTRGKEPTCPVQSTVSRKSFHDDDATPSPQTSLTEIEPAAIPTASLAQIVPEMVLLGEGQIFSDIEHNVQMAADNAGTEPDCVIVGEYVATSQAEIAATTNSDQGTVLDGGDSEEQDEILDGIRFVDISKPVPESVSKKDVRFASAYKSTRRQRCGFCRREFELRDQAALFSHLNAHFAGLKTAQHMCQICDVGFVHKADLQRHVQSAAKSNHCGLEFDHHIKCTGHHPPFANTLVHEDSINDLDATLERFILEEDRIAFAQAVRLWEHLQLKAVSSSTQNLVERGLPEADHFSAHSGCPSEVSGRTMLFTQSENLDYTAKHRNPNATITPRVRDQKNNESDDPPLPPACRDFETPEELGRRRRELQDERRADVVRLNETIISAVAAYQACLTNKASITPRSIDQGTKTADDGPHVNYHSLAELCLHLLCDSTDFAKTDRLLAGSGAPPTLYNHIKAELDAHNQRVSQHWSNEFVFGRKGQTLSHRDLYHPFAYALSRGVSLTFMACLMAATQKHLIDSEGTTEALTETFQWGRADVAGLILSTTRREPRLSSNSREETPEAVHERQIADHLYSPITSVARFCLRRGVEEIYAELKELKHVEADRPDYGSRIAKAHIIALLQGCIEKCAAALEGGNAVLDGAAAQTQLRCLAFLFDEARVFSGSVRSMAYFAHRPLSCSQKDCMLSKGRREWCKAVYAIEPISLCDLLSWLRDSCILACHRQSDTAERSYISA